MPFDLPGTLTSDSAEKYIVSIRLQPDGLSFSGYVQGMPSSFFLRRTLFDRGKPYGEAFKEWFFDNHFLAWDYREVRIIPVSSRYTLVPRPFFDETKKEQIMTLVFLDPDPCFLSNTTCDDLVILIFDISPDIHSFCSRSFSHPRFIHSITPQLTFFRRQSRVGLSARMYGISQDNSLHVFCFRGDSILFVNTFSVTVMDDLLYYLLFIWNHVGFDREKDELYLSTGTGHYNTLALTLSTYLRYVRPVEFPSESYLLGSEMERAPVDLRLLPVCV
jgi:hypothetical protein